MEEDTEYFKLPLEERCVHKLWKARLNGYEECTAYFAKVADDKSPEFAKFAPLMKKFVIDSNVAALDKALEAVLVFIENAHIAGRTATDVTAGIVAKCLAAPKKSTQDKAQDVLLMYCEIEKSDPVLEELIKGISQKNPKIVIGCVKVITNALKEFGNKVISIKSLVKCISPLLEDRDKGVREEGKKMVVEMFRWVGEALKPQLGSLKPVQIQELEQEFEKMPKEKVTPTRFLRSQQELRAKRVSHDGGSDEIEEDEDVDTPVEVDPLDLMSEVNILDKLPKDFYELADSKQWKQRKEAMDILLPLTQNAKLEMGDYSELVKILKKIISKDTNVMIITLAGQCVAGIAKGLKKKFSPFAVSCAEVILEKFKEKKQNVISALREAIDAVFQSTTIEAIQEIACAALNNKNPSVKAETASFLARAFAFCTPTTLNKKLLKAFSTELLRTLSESDATVRDSSAEAIGTMMKVVGDKALDPFLHDVDTLRMQKIKECCEKAEIKVKFKPVTSSAIKTTESMPKVVRPSDRMAPKTKVVKTGRQRKPISGKGGEGKMAAAAQAVRGRAKLPDPEEEDMTLEEAIDKVREVMPELCVTALADANWKTRLSAMEDFNKDVQNLELKDIPTFALMKTLADKTGFKDNNFQIFKLKLDAVKFLAENSTTFNRPSASLCLHDLIEKLTDPKNGTYVGEVLSTIAAVVSLQWVALEATNYAFTQKNPKLQEVVLKWLSDAIKEFGFVLQLKCLVPNIKCAFAQSSPNVRAAGISLCGTIFMYSKDQLKSNFADEKSFIIQQMDAEFEKMVDETPPDPIRKQASSFDDDGVEMLDENVPLRNGDDYRVNISEQITPTLIAELEDKNWKVRIEALAKVAALLNDAKCVQHDIGELPTAICARLSDTNKNIAGEALRITSSLAAALGEHCKSHTRTIVPGIFSVMGDTKQSMRQQALVALNNWVEHLGSVREVFDGEMCMDALKSGSPLLKVELISWMSEKLRDAPPKSVNKDELHGCVGYIYAGLEDRSVEIRRVSNDAIFPFMLHLGYEAMVKHSSLVKPSSKNTVIQALEKAKANLPNRPTPLLTKAKSGSVGSGEKGIANGKAPVLRRGVTKAPSPAAKGTTRKEDVDTSPLLAVNNLKQQRIVDEQRLRSLRWDFQTPRPDFITQLKDQMISAGINRVLLSNMFHQDFKFHIKAIDALTEDLTENVDACIANLDLVLRWLTIRFFDTNPSVNLKAMDYLMNIFSCLSDKAYILTDHEAYSFLPYLIMKFGDPKDSIRGPARNIIKRICNIYPASKLSVYILDGLKSKNARLRAECLETMGTLIEGYGISICQPTPGAALKEVAKQIADRDNAVRNAALNCLLQVYFKEGERVYKLIGAMSDKDHTLLEERIKRASKNRPMIKKSSLESEVPVVVRGASGGGGRGNRVIPTAASHPSPVIRDDSAVFPYNENSGMRRSHGQRPLSADMSKYNSRFQIDYEFMEKLLEGQIPLSRPKFELEEIPDMASVLSDKMTCPILSSRMNRFGLAPAAIRANTVNANIDLEDASQAINVVISQLTTPDVNTVITALSQLNEVIQSKERCSQLIPHIDQFLMVATVQYRLVLNTKMADINIHKEECIRTYRSLTNCLMNIFSNSELGTKATRDVLHDVIHVVISILLDSRLTQLEDGPQITRAINVLVVRIIEKAQFTQIFSALLKLLHESVSTGVNSKFTELVMKCNWKIIRILPSKTNDLNPVQILQDTHDFMLAFPSNTWAERPNNTPLRTIKTVLHNLVKIYGSTILTHLSKVPNADGSEIHKYLLKDLNSTQKSEEMSGEGGGLPVNKNVGGMPPTTEPSNKTSKGTRRLSKDANAVLSDIFKKIGDKENTKEGLIQLYDFKQKYPEADIDTYLRKSSTFFQNYIERGLKKVEMERQCENVATSNVVSDGNSNTATPLSSIQVQDVNNINMNELVDQFKVIAAQAGFDNTYIDSAVKDICSSESGKDGSDVKDYIASCHE